MVDKLISLCQMKRVQEYDMIQWYICWYINGFMGTVQHIHISQMLLRNVDTNFSTRFWNSLSDNIYIKTLYIVLYS